MLDFPRRRLPLLPVSPIICALFLSAPLRAEDDPHVGEMVVEGEPFDPANPGQTAASVTVLPVDETVASTDDVAAVVERSAGAVVRRLGGLGDYAAVSIRGSSFRQVQVFLDGVPLNPDGSDAVNLSELPLAAFRRIEVYRSGAPPQLGAAPIGGVVNLVSADEPAPPSASATYGQLDTMRLSVAAAPTGTVGSFDTDGLVFAELFSTSGDYRYFTDNGTPYNVFDDDRPTRAHNSKSQLSSFGRWRLGNERHQLVISDAFLARKEDLPGPTSAPASAVDLETVRNLATVQLSGCTPEVGWQGRLWHLRRGELYDDRLGEIGTGTQWQRSRTETAGGLGSVSVAVAPWLLPAVTLSARRDGYEQADLLTDQTEDPRRRWAASGALSADGWLLQDQLKLSPVVQFSWLNNRQLGTVPFGTLPVAPEGEDVVWAVLPRGGVLLRPAAIAGLAVKANAGRYFRPPDFTELFGDRGGIIGNTDLVPERGAQWDAGLRYDWPENAAVNGALDAAWFSSTAEDQIVFVQNSQSTSVPINLTETHAHGVEAALTLEVLGVLDSQSSLTWTRSENRTPSSSASGNQLPRIPTWEGHQATSLHWKEHARLGHTYSYTDGNYWDTENFFLAAPRAIHGAFLRFGGGSVSAEASVLNLTDQTVVVMDRNPLSDDDDTTILQPLTDFIGYPLPGRTWLFTVKWSG